MLFHDILPFSLEFGNLQYPEVIPVKNYGIKKCVDGFKKKDFKVKPGSILKSDIRKYYIINRFSYMKEKVNEEITNSSILKS